MYLFRGPEEQKSGYVGESMTWVRVLVLDRERRAVS